MSDVRFECPACERLVPVGAVRVEREEVLLTCPRCKGVTRLATGVTQVGGSAPSGLRPPAQASSASAATPFDDRRRDRPPPSDGENVYSFPPKPSESGPSGAEGSSPAPHLAEVLPLHSGHAHPFTDVSPFEVPAGHCAKCVAPRAEGLVSCPQCGLLYDAFTPELGKPSPRLAQAWTETIECWREPEAHAVFLKQAAVMGELAEAGRLYRIAIARSPNDEAALQARAEIVRMALVPGLPERAARTGDEQRKRKHVLLVALLCGAVLLAAMATAVFFG